MKRSRFALVILLLSTLALAQGAYPGFPVQTPGSVPDVEPIVFPGPGGEGGSPVTLQVSPGGKPQQIWSFGDSITYGVGATTPNLNWVSILADTTRWSVINFGLSGGWVADETDQIFSVAVASNSISTMLTSVNDMRGINTNSTAQAAFGTELYAVIPWLATLDSNKAKGQGGSVPVTYTGTWNLPTSGAGTFTQTTCMNATTVGSTASFSVTGTVVYVASLQQQGNASTFGITIDGTNEGTFKSSTVLPTTGSYNRSFGPYGLRFAGLGGGAHTVILTASTGTNGGNPVYFCYGAGNAANGSYAYIGNTLSLTAAGYASGGGSPTAVSEFNALISSVVRTLAGDGLNVVYVNANAAYNPNTMTVADGIHPNNLGHATIAATFASSITHHNRFVRSAWNRRSCLRFLCASSTPHCQSQFRRVRFRSIAET